MKDKISVSIGSDHSYDCKTDVIGRAGEGNVTQMEFKIPSKLCSCSFYLDFEKPNGETYRTPKLPINDGVATYNVQPFVLTDSGEIKVQAVLEKASGEVWKSDIKMYINRKSINVSEDIDGYIVPSGTLYIRENGTWDCSSYATVEVTVEPYTVKGIVELDPVALSRNSNNIEQNISFQLYEEDMDGDHYSKIRFLDGNLTYIKSNGTEHTVFEYSKGASWIGGNYSGDPSKLNFGDYAQVLSAEFFLWLKSVEKQQGGGESTATLIEKTFTANDTYNASDYGADGFSSVTVNVPTGSGGTDTSDADVTASDVIKGKIFYGANGRDEGTMPSVTENTPTLTLEGDGNGNVTIKHLQMFNTYLPADETNIGTVAVENLAPSKIKKNETILGVTGEYEGEGSGGGGSLEAPTISITDKGILTITDTNESTKSFDIYVDGVFAVNIAKGEELDLLSVEMATGDRIITAKSLVQSGASEGVTYTASTNWEAELKGTWVMNDYVEFVNYGTIAVKCYAPNGTSSSWDHFKALSFINNETGTYVYYTTSKGSGNALWQSTIDNGKIRYPNLATWEFRDDYAEYATDGVVSQEDLEFLVLWLRANGVKDTTTDTQALNIITEGE